MTAAAAASRLSFDPNQVARMLSGRKCADSNSLVLQLQYQLLRESRIRWNEFVISRWEIILLFLGLCCCCCCCLTSTDCSPADEILLHRCCCCRSCCCRFQISQVQRRVKETFPYASLITIQSGRKTIYLQEWIHEIHLPARNCRYFPIISEPFLRGRFCPPMREKWCEQKRWPDLTAC
jgi:hypothetical protein